MFTVGGDPPHAVARARLPAARFLGRFLRLGLPAPRFGSWPLSRITTSDVKAMLSDELTRGAPMPRRALPTDDPDGRLRRFAVRRTGRAEG